ALLLEDGQYYVYQCDHLGTPLRLVTPKGDVVWQAHYETWGEAQIEIERVVNPLRYQGQYYDAETGLHYNLARYYDPRTGRFIQPDPIGLLGGLNHYQYAPNPVMWIDPTGLCAKEDSTLPVDALAENPQQTLITSTLPASYQLSMLAAMQAPAPVPGSLPSSRPPAIGRINVGTAANDPMYNRLSPKPRLKLLPLAGTASTFLTGMLYSPSLGGSLEEMVAPDGTTYSKYSDERLYKAVGADGEVWHTVDPQEDLAYRAWLANGGDGTFEEWIAQGKPEYSEGDDKGPSLSQAKIDEIIVLPKGSRPNPNEYLSKEYQEEILSKFDNGASRFMTKGNMAKYGPAQQDGTSFVMPKSEADKLIQSTGGDKRKLEDALGLPENFLDDNELVRVDIPEPRNLNLRIPSGNEAGANDLWIPGGKLPDGNTEAVVDLGGVFPSEYTSSPLRL
ncbi:RHS repeat domain-containing protein, partial [Vibrio cincinnatiensis]|uniref:RHS repeat domain-containing protein n=2 Tax=Vibrio cincinnatiensis TaxID=675 RepID=UPI001EDD6ED7